MLQASEKSRQTEDLPETHVQEAENCAQTMKQPMSDRKAVYTQRSPRSFSGLSGEYRVQSLEI